MYTKPVAINITEFRRNLFQLADRALQGEPVEFIHKGVILKIVPSVLPPKLARLTRETIVAPAASLDTAELFQEMEKEWKKDWSEI